MAGVFPLLHKQEKRLIVEELRRRVSAGQDMAQFAMAFTADGPVDRVALARAFNIAVMRHAALRTIIVPRSGYDMVARQMQLQTFARTGLYIPGMYEQRPLDHAEVELSEREWSGDREELDALAREECAKPLDLSTAPALRVLLLASKREHFVIVNLSHLVLDLWAVLRLHHEVAHAYTAFSAGRPWERPPVRQHHDLVRAEIAMMRSPDGEQHLAYWAAHYAAIADALINASELPFAIRTPGPPSFDAVHLSLSDDDARLVHEACGGPPDYAFWRTMYGIALGMLVNKTRVAFTANFLNRRQPGGQNVLAWCAHPHMLAVEAPWSRPWAEVRRQVRIGLRQAQAHEAYSLDSVAQSLARPVGATNTFLTFDVVPGHSKYRDAPLQAADVPGGARVVDLALRVQHVKHGYTLVATFNSGRYESDGVSRLVTVLRDTIRACAAQPSATVGEVVRAVRERQRNAAPKVIA